MLFKKVALWFLFLFSEKEQVEESTKTPSRPKRYISNHAKIRFEQRHGIVFTDAQAKSIVNDIISKKAQFLQVLHGKTEEWIAKYGGKKYRVVFSLKNKIIVTVYTSIKKKKKRKPRGKKKIKTNGTHRTRHGKKPKPSTYKRSTTVMYKESML